MTGYKYRGKDLDVAERGDDGRRKVSRELLKPCGTHAAYRRHLRDGQKTCGPCRAARAAYAKR